jgi:hypothetical protein
MNGKQRKRLWREHQRMMFDAFKAVITSDATDEQKREGIVAVSQVAAKSFRQLKRTHVRSTNRP